MGDGGRGSSKGSYEDETPPQCRKAACAIQECLAAKNHQQEACREVIERFNECVRLARAAGATPDRPASASADALGRHDAGPMRRATSEATCLRGESGARIGPETDTMIIPLLLF
eukprot:tig00000796_g4227.t2